MITGRDKIREFEDDLLRREPPDRKRNLAIYEALYRQALALGALPAADPLDGLDTTIRLAERLNRV